jgi:DNA-binding response OmpR family regulator
VAVAVSRSSKQKTILVVDDHDDVRQGLAERLASEGYRVVTAQDGIDALDILDWEAVDLLVLDLEMPRLDGKGVMAALSADPRLAKLPVILMTGASYHWPSNLTALRKPFACDLLLERIQDAIGRPGLRSSGTAAGAALIDAFRRRAAGDGGTKSAPPARVAPPRRKRAGHR